MNLHAAIHIGSTAVCTVIGCIEHSGDQSYLKILAVGLAHTNAFSQGRITYREHLRSAVHKSLQEAMDMSNINIINPLMSFATPLMESSNELAVVDVEDLEGVIHAEDLYQAHWQIQERLAAKDAAVLQACQQIVSLQSGEQVLDAIGLRSKQISVACHVMSIPSTSHQQMLDLVLDQEIDASTTVFDGVAGASYALTKAEKHQGVCYIDIGATMTKVCLYYDNTLLYSKCLPVGGQTVDMDIAKECNISLQDAESFKRQEGTLNHEKYSMGAHVIYKEGTKYEKTMLRRELNQVIEARYYGIFAEIFEDIHRVGLAGGFDAGVVLAGGGASMDGIVGFVRSRFGVPVRMVTTPMIKLSPTLSDENLKLLQSHLQNNTLHSAIGTLMYGMSEEFARDQQINLLDDDSEGFFGTMVQKFQAWLARFKKFA
ncbi:cell division protein FtsA [Moraxella sp.]|uniref:cell division protein FtsA n=1 Tax=Moraxella sp. TaxID=479 RepID=UPI0026DA7A3E|nr:cell division protein FtsA [Moraxella sp.]MDO4895558.1 cell division protein FtsA [Moraxella sp.]